MIVITIIGILAAIALPLYQDYVVKTQTTRVSYELNTTRTAVEMILGVGVFPQQILFKTVLCLALESNILLV